MVNALEAALYDRISSRVEQLVDKKIEALVENQIVLQRHIKNLLGGGKNSQSFEESRVMPLEMEMVEQPKNIQGVIDKSEITHIVQKSKNYVTERSRAI